MEDEAKGLEVLADSAYGSGATRAGSSGRHRLVIKPLPSRPTMPGGFVRDDFLVDHDARTVTCPAGHVARLCRAASPSSPRIVGLSAAIPLHEGQSAQLHRVRARRRTRRRPSGVGRL